ALSLAPCLSAASSAFESHVRKPYGILNEIVTGKVLDIGHRAGDGRNEEALGKPRRAPHGNKGLSLTSPGSAGPSKSTNARWRNPGSGMSRRRPSRSSPRSAAARRG